MVNNKCATHFSAALSTIVKLISIPSSFTNLASLTTQTAEIVLTTELLLLDMAHMRMAKIISKLEIAG